MQRKLFDRIIINKLDESQLLFFADACAKILLSITTTSTTGFVIYLQGELGAGKTTFTRALLNSFGYEGKVKSPTYTLVEEYYINDCTIYHFDLYRLSVAEELEYIGIKDYLNNSLCIFEWPDKGYGMIPNPDVVIKFTFANTLRNLEIISYTLKAKTIISELKNKYEHNT